MKKSFFLSNFFLASCHPLNFPSIRSSVRPSVRPSVFHPVRTTSNSWFFLNTWCGKTSEKGCLSLFQCFFKVKHQTINTSSDFRILIISLDKQIRSLMEFGEQLLLLLLVKSVLVAIALAMNLVRTKRGM